MHSRPGFPQVELVYDDACPNVALARNNLLAAFELAGVAPKWTEHRIRDPKVPAHARGYGSPTILVDGADVAGGKAGSDDCCRIYTTAERTAKAPSFELIAAALARSAAR